MGEEAVREADLVGGEALGRPIVPAPTPDPDSPATAGGAEEPAEASEDPSDDDAPPRPRRVPLPRRFAGAPLALVAPESLAERWDVQYAIRTRSGPAHRLLAAAFGLCNPRVRQRCPYDPARGLAAYGGEVIDLLSRSPDPPTIDALIEVAWHAYDLCMSGPTIEGVVAKRDFSDAP